MKLEDCKKNELLEILEELQKQVFYGKQVESFIQFKLSELEQEKESSIFEKATELKLMSVQKRREMFELLGKYDGRKIKDIPREVLDKVTKLAEEAEKLTKKADRYWNQYQRASLRYRTNGSEMEVEE